MLERKNSFVVIDIYSQMELDNIKYVRNLKIYNSIYRSIIDICYFYITYYFTIFKIYSKKFYEYKYIEIRDIHHDLILKRLYTNEFIINDTCIVIYIGTIVLEIPYENIAQFRMNVEYNMLELIILGKINIDTNSCTLDTNTDISRVYLFVNNNSIFYNSNIHNCFNNIKNHLYYHLRFNNFNYNIIDYYNKLREKNNSIKVT